MGSRVARRVIDQGNPIKVVPASETGQVVTPQIYKPFTITVASVNTVATVWVPAAGSRVRLQGYTLSVSSQAFGVFRAAGQTSQNYQFNTKRMTPSVEGDTVTGISYPIPTTGIALTLDSSVAGVQFTGRRDRGSTQPPQAPRWVVEPTAPRRSQKHSPPSGPMMAIS